MQIGGNVWIVPCRGGRQRSYIMKNVPTAYSPSMIYRLCIYCSKSHDYRSLRYTFVVPLVFLVPGVRFIKLSSKLPIVCNGIIQRLAGRLRRGILTIYSPHN